MSSTCINMNYSVKTKLSDNIFYIVFQEGNGNQQTIETPLDKLGCDIMEQKIKNFIDDNPDYVVSITQDDDIGIIVDLFDDDDELYDTKTFWFDDFSE